MKLSNEYESVVSTIEGESADYTIAATGKAFDILFSGLYSDKHGSIVRELASNAYDAHVAAGIADQPFHIQLPTQLAPTFAIRDYGVAMTHDEVMHLYTTVFASSKTQSNDFVGAWGLGSKTPFAYTDAFVVKVWRDGRLRIYLVAKTATGTPTITLQADGDSDEPRGVEISFPVKSHDFHTFRLAVLKQSKGFDVKPTVPGLTFAESETLFEGETWKLYDNTDGAGHYVKQGCVIYPVDRYQVGGAVDSAATQPNVYTTRLVVEVPIGQVQFTASREDLQYDDTTIANVGAALTVALNELGAQVDASIEEASDFFEATKRALILEDHFHLKNLKYKGRSLTGYIQFKPGESGTPDVILNHKGQWQHGLKLHVNHADTVKFVIDRGQKVPRKVSRIRAFWKLNDERVFVLKNPSAKSLAALVRRLHLNAEQIVSIVNIPDVPLRPRAPRNSSSTAGQLSGVYDAFERIPDELPSDYYWLQVPGLYRNGWTIGDVIDTYDSGYRSGLSTARALHEILPDSGDKPLILFTPSAVKRYKPDAADELWAVGEPALEDAAERLLEQNAKVVVGQLLNSYSSLYLDGDILSALVPDYEAVAGDNAVSLNGNLAHYLRTKHAAEYLAQREEAEKQAKEIVKKYPLLFRSYVSARDFDKAVIDYIDTQKSEEDDQ